MEQQPIISEPVLAPPVLNEPPQQQQLTIEQKVHMMFEAKAGEFVKKVLDYPCSRKTLQNAWAQAIIYPLSKEEPHFSYPEQKEVFELYTDAISAKFMLMLLGFKEKGDIEFKSDFMTKFAEQVTFQPDNINKTQGENSNGS